MAGASDLASMVPGFDFLQGLFKNAGASLPSMGQWIAPTLDPEELEKRIQELKTVQFWLEQNARLLATTIQALEVQRMTLSTLQNMNLPLTELGEALKIKMPMAAPPAPAPAPAPRAPAPRFVAEPAPEAEAPAEPPAAAPAQGSARKGAAAGAAPLAGADPMQWWGALTQQFTELAARAVRDAAPQRAAAEAAAAPQPAAPRSPARKAAAPRKTAPRARSR